MGKYTKFIEKVTHKNDSRAFSGTFLVLGILLVISIIVISVFFILPKFNSESTNLIYQGQILDTTNYGTYDLSTSTITVKDEDNVTLFKAKRVTPYINNIFRSNSKAKQDWRPVACYNVTDFKTNYKDFNTDMEFYDLKDNNKTFNRNFDWRYAEETITKVPRIRKTCDNLKDNITQQTCDEEIIGYTDNIKTKYYPFNELSEINKNTKICLFTYVAPNERAEYVPTFAEVRFPQDAVWVDSFEYGLLSWYKMDETSGTNVSDWTGRSDGATQGSPVWQAGKINNGLWFGGASDFVDNISVAISGEMSVTGWINMTDDAGWAKYLTDGNDDARGVFIDDFDKIRTYVAGKSDVVSTSALLSDVYYHIVIVYNTTDTLIYINGTLETSQSNDARPVGGFSEIGDDDGTEKIFGQLDEIGFYNRTLNQTDVTALYNDKVGLTPIGDDSPIVFLRSPANVSSFTEPNVTFNCTSTDTTGILNTSLYIDGVINSTVVNSSTNQLNLSLYIPLNFTDGTHNYTCDTYDTVIQQGTNTTYTYYINTSTLINISFSNVTARSIYKSVFQEGENFFTYWNYTNANNEVLNDSVAACNLTLFDVVIEENAVTNNFDLCDSGQGCDQSNPLTETFTIHTSNTTEGVMRDFLEIEICHAQLIQRDLQVSFECGAVTDTKTINLTQFGLCSGGFSRVVVPTTACMNSLEINVTLDNNANINGRRHNISHWEIDRELTKHTDTFVDGEVLFNITTQLWQSNISYKRYKHGTVRADVNCTLNQSAYYNNDTSKNITIVNTAPTIGDGQVRTNTNSYNLVVGTTIIEYDSGNWTWIIPITDDDLFNHNLTWYNSSGDVLKSVQDLGEEAPYNTTNGTFFTFSTGNTYNLTVWANDTNGSMTTRQFLINVTDTTAPILTAPANQSLINNQSLGVQFTATDTVALSGFQDNWTTIFTINSSGYLSNSSTMYPTTFFINVSVNDTSDNKDSAIFQVFVKSNTSLTIYDEINNTVVNTTLWNSVLGGNTTVTENKNYMLTYQYSNSAGNDGATNSNVYSKKLPVLLINIEKVELKAYLDAAYDDDGDTTGVSRSRLIVFGNTIHEVKANVTDENPTGDLSVWTFEKNTTKGNTWYEVYNDGVFNQTINGTDTNVTLYTYIDDQTSGISWVDTRLYYIYYDMGEGAVTVTTNSPANNTAYLNTETVTFNVTTSTSIGNLTNATLYINDVVNETKVLTLNTSENIYTKSFSIGSYTWYVQSCNSNDGCSNSTRRNITVSSYKENSLTYNTTTTEGTTEEFILSITTNGTAPTSGFLSYNNTLYAATITNPAANNYSLTRSLTIPLVSGIMPLYFNFDIGGTDHNTTSYNQTVSPTTFGLCNSSLTVPYVNYTFADEGNASALTGTIPSSKFYYWISVQNVNKSLTFTNTTGYNSYAFCYSPTYETINVFYSIQYAATGYPARTIKDTVSYSNTTTNTTLYLTHTDDGIYITFQVIDAGENNVAGVYSNATLVSSGAVVGSGYTDSAGSITFWLDPDSTYKFSFEKTGFDIYTTTLQPTQTEYTIQFGGSTTTINDTKRKGVNVRITPKANAVLYNNSDVSFNLSLTSLYWAISEFGFTISNTTDTLSSNSSSNSGGFVTLTQNLGTSKNIIMNYYYVSNGTYTNNTMVWYVITSGGTDWSLSVFFTDLTTYLGTGLFGLDNFGLGLIIFLLIFITIGIMSYKFGIVNPAAISVMLFMLVAFFDWGTGILSPLNPIEAIPNFPTLFMGVVMGALLLREVMK